MISLLDGLIQRYAFLQRNGIDGVSRFNVGHHLIGRRNMLLRHDIINIFPCTPYQHRLIHEGKINPLNYLSDSRIAYLKKMQNIDFKQYLLINGLTKEDFLKRQKIKLLAEIKELE